MRYHSPYRMLNDPDGVCLHHFFQANTLNTAGVTGVVVIELIFGLVSGDTDFISVGDDHVVTGIQAFGEDWLVLTH